MEQKLSFSFTIDLKGFVVIKPLDMLENHLWQSAGSERPSQTIERHRTK